jgi:hypothetical protein
MLTDRVKTASVMASVIREYEGESDKYGSEMIMLKLRRKYMMIMFLLFYYCIACDGKLSNHVTGAECKNYGDCLEKYGSGYDCDSNKGECIQFGDGNNECDTIQLDQCDSPIKGIKDGCMSTCGVEGSCEWDFCAYGPTGCLLIYYTAYHQCLIDSQCDKYGEEHYEDLQQSHCIKTYIADQLLPDCSNFDVCYTNYTWCLRKY